MARKVQVGRRIAEARRAANLTQEALGTAVGYSRRSIAGWEGGERVPPIRVLETIARVLERDVHWFYVPAGGAK